jgi:hypothetical protein
LGFLDSLRQSLHLASIKTEREVIFTFVTFEVIFLLIGNELCKLNVAANDLNKRGNLMKKVTLSILLIFTLSCICAQAGFDLARQVDLQNLVDAVEADSVLSYIQGLQDFGTRYCFADNRAAVSQWIRDLFISFGVPHVELQQFELDGTDQYNVVATIPGSVYPDEYIIVGGHHDSLSANSDPFELAPGADDNASGTAACLEMARVMMACGYRPKRSIRFVTFAAEEWGMHGSYAYAGYALENEMDIRLMINHDMIANNTADPSDWQVRLMPYEVSLEHSYRAQNITSLYTNMQTYFGELNSLASDGVPFWEAGYDVVYFFEDVRSPYIHTSDDTVENIDPAYAAEVIRASTAVAATFADMPQSPANLVVHNYGDGESLHLAWDLSPDPAVSHYRIHWGSGYSDLADNYVDCTGSSYILSGLTEGTPYLVGVYSVDAFGLESMGALGTGTPFDAPLAPTELTGSPARRHVQLSWQPNHEHDLAGYKVYRSTEADAQGSLLATVPASDTSYRDQSVNGGLHSYYYRVCGFDHDGNIGPASQVIRSRPLTLNQGALIVDETIGGSGSTVFTPTDEMVDEFYADMLDVYEPQLIDLAKLDELQLIDLGVFSCLLWHGNDLTNISSAAACTDVLREYVGMGGKVLFSVYHPSTAFEMNAGYPATFEAGDFIYDVLGIAEVDFTNQSRFKTALPLQPGYPLIQVDPLKSLSALNHHINRVEGMTPTDNATAIYAYAGEYDNDSAQGYLNGLAVGIKNDYALGSAITLSFPLYYMETDSAKALVQHVFRHEFAELYPAEIGGNTPAASLSLSLPAPNPFSASARITLKANDCSQNTSLKIYNQRGQLVRTLMQDKPIGVEVFSWDARDDDGNRVSSGVYFLQAKQGDQSITRKMVYIR